MAIHMYDKKTLFLAEDFVVKEYRVQGRTGTICGYIRQEVVTDPKIVTCKLCLRLLKLPMTLKRVNKIIIKDNGSASILRRPKRWEI